MQNRLVAQNVIKTPLKGDSYFNINKKLLAYSSQQVLKIKSFNRQSKQFQIKLNNQNVKHFQLSIKCSWVYIITSSNVLQIWNINQDNQQISTKICNIKGVLSAKQVHQSVILDCSDNFYRVLPIQLVKSAQKQNNKQIPLQKLYSLQKKISPSTILHYPYNQNIYIKTTINSTNLSNLSVNNNNNQQQLITVYSLRKTGKYQKTIQIDYIKHPIAIYKDRYVFNLNKQINNNNLQIYDVNLQNLIGNITIEGELKYAKIRQNLLLLILNVDNTDYYWFCSLNPKPDSTSNLITHKIIYQRGRGDYYDFFNMKTQQALNFTDKKKQQTLTDLFPLEVDNTTSSIIYVLNKQKQKVQIIKFDHAKLLQSSFSQQKIEKKVASNIVKNKVEQEKKIQNQQTQRNRIKSSMEHKSQGRTLQQTQKKFVQAIVDIRIKGMMKKFQQLQERVQRLQRTMKLIYQKMDQNIKNVNRQEIRSSVQSLFEQLTPQFQKYFSQLFKQVSGVLDQGVSFYNKKLAAQAQIHKQALNQIVTKTFEQTEKIIEISKKQQKLSQRTEKHLSDLLDARKKWQEKTDDFEQQSRQVTFSDTKVYRQPGEGKVFIRADLNQASKKQT